MGASSTRFTNDTLSPEVVLTDGAYLAMGLYMCALGIASFVMNLFVIVVLWKGQPKFHVVHTRLLYNIAVSDFLLSSVAYPFNVVASFSKGWPFSYAACEFDGFWVFALAQNNMNTLAAMSICRYVIACKPQYEYYLKRKSATYIMFAVIWGHALFVTSLPLFGWSRYKMEPFGASCTIDWTDRSTSVIAYNTFTILVCYVLHVGIFIFCYTYIIRGFSGNSQLGKPIKDSQTDEMAYQTAMATWKSQMEASRRVSITALSMVTAFLISWTPYAFCSMYVMRNGKEGVPSWVLVIPTMFAKSSTLLTPVVCSLMSSNFREAFFRIIGGNNRVHPISLEGGLPK